VGRDQRIEIERLAKKASVALLEQARRTSWSTPTSMTSMASRCAPSGGFRRADHSGGRGGGRGVAAQDPSIDKQRLAWVVLTRDELKTRWAS